MQLSPISFEGMNAQFNPVQTTNIKPNDVNFLNAIQHSTEQYENSIELVKSYALGNNVPIHQVMIALENSKLSYQFAVQIRNKLVEAYQDITRMQV